MPTETIIVVTIITVAFVGFAATLAWADFYSGRSRHDHRPAE